jgi:hypothetical protein
MRSRKGLQEATETHGGPKASGPMSGDPPVADESKNNKRPKDATARDRKRGSRAREALGQRLSRVLLVDSVAQVRWLVDHEYLHTEDPTLVQLEMALTDLLADVTRDSSDS